jgi:HlyD family secretion protein
MKNVRFIKSCILVIIIIMPVIFITCSDDNRISASGNIEIKEVDIASLVSGRISKKYAEKGDAVRKGSTLAEIDNRIVNAQYNDVKAVFTQAQDEYERSKQLYRSGSISRQRYDQAEAAFNQIKSKLLQSEIMKEEAFVKAPWDGVILDSYIEEGELLSALSPLYTIGDMKSAKLNVYLSLKEMERIKVGAIVKIKIDAYPDREFFGKIVYISDKAEFTPKNIQTKDERVKEVFKVEIQLPNEEGIFKPGMPADAVIDVKMQNIK